MGTRRGGPDGSGASWEQGPYLVPQSPYLVPHSPIWYPSPILHPIPLSGTPSRCMQYSYNNESPKWNSSLLDICEFQQQDKSCSFCPTNESRHNTESFDKVWTAGNDTADWQVFKETQTSWIENTKNGKIWPYWSVKMSFTDINLSKKSTLLWNSTGKCMRVNWCFSSSYYTVEKSVFAVEEVRFSLNIQAKMWQETTERQTV